MAAPVMTGQLIRTCLPNQRHQEWLWFLRLIDRWTPPNRDVHLIVGNYATRKHPAVQSWFLRHPRFHLHFILPSSSWLNLVDRGCQELTTKGLRRGVFKSVPDLVAAIKAFIAKQNRHSRLFTWTAKGEDLLGKVERARAVLHKMASV